MPGIRGDTRNGFYNLLMPNEGYDCQMQIANLLPQKIVSILIPAVAFMVLAQSALQSRPLKDNAPVQEEKSANKKAEANINSVEILSDTRSVDFGPYIQRLRYRIQRYWEAQIPPVALSPSNKSGTVTIEFTIARDGAVKGMKFISSSGSVAMDAAAWHGITEAAPLPILPLGFKDDYLQLRCNFYYNPPAKQVREAKHERK
jgi:TonB family protein